MDESCTVAHGGQPLASRKGVWFGGDRGAVVVVALVMVW